MASPHTGPHSAPPPKVPPKPSPTRAPLRWLAENFSHIPPTLRLVWKSSPRATLALGLLTVLAALAPISIAYLGKRIFDAVVAGDYSSASRWVLAEFGLVATQALLARALAFCRSALGARLSLDINVRILEKAQSLELRYFEDAEFYDQLTRARREASSRPISVISEGFQLLQNGLTLAGYAALLLQVNPLVVLGLLVAAIPATLVEMKFSGAAFRLRNWRSPDARRQNYLEYVLANNSHAKEVKLFGLGPLLLERYQKQGEIFYHEDLALTRKRSVWAYSLSLVGAGAFYAAYAWMAVSAAEGKLSLGDLTLYVAAFRQGQQAFQSILGSVGGMYESNLYMSNLFSFFQLQPDARPAAPAENVNQPSPRAEKNEESRQENTQASTQNGTSQTAPPAEKQNGTAHATPPTEKPNGTTDQVTPQGETTEAAQNDTATQVTPPANGALHQNEAIQAEAKEKTGGEIASSTIERPASLLGLRLENVGFRYPGQERFALRHIDIDIPAGQSLALVGHNGAGKTTFIKLLTRLYEPSEGRILLDGRDLRDWDLAALHQRYAVVFQDFNQYQFSARENVGLGSLPHRDDTPRISRAISRGGAEDVIAKLPEGLDSQLGRWFQRGSDLSGGQWQKIALSRAFMREEADILILDEPTAALDAEAEHQVFERFRTLSKGRTAILISHRFPTVRMADRILVIEGGIIQEQGSHAQLLSQGGRYAKLFQLQAQGYL